MRNRAKLKKEKGFTLLEMLVVIGLLVIVTTVAVPQFKKCFQDLRLNKTLDDLDSLWQSTRSYYLIMNEVPEDEASDRVSEEMAWAVQANFLGPKKNENDDYYYNITIKNFSNWPYDWDFWPDEDNVHPQWAILFHENDTNSKNLALNKMRNRFGNSLNEINENSGRLYLSLLEIPKANKENRYY